MESVTMITDSRAREIAAQWQSMGREGFGMAQFASTGTITESLLDDVSRELESQWQMVRAQGLDVSAIPDELCDLSELDTYVAAQKVTVWTVGHNQPGCLPDSVESVSWHLDYADAIEAYVDVIAEMHSEWFRDAECECTDGEMCDMCGMEALIRAYVVDDMPHVVNGKVFGTVRELGLSLRPEHLAVPTEFWVNRIEVSVADYRDRACS